MMHGRKSIKCQVLNTVLSTFQRFAFALKLTPKNKAFSVIFNGSQKLRPYTVSYR
jgi:hypothetical protein